MLNVNIWNEIMPIEDKAKRFYDTFVPVGENGLVLVARGASEARRQIV